VPEEMRSLLASIRSRSSRSGLDGVKRRALVEVPAPALANVVPVAPLGCLLRATGILTTTGSPRRVSSEEILPDAIASSVGRHRTPRSLQARLEIADGAAEAAQPILQV
jgi:hypothetical protein